MGFFGDVVEGIFGTDAAEVPELDATGQAIQAGQLEQLQRSGELQQDLQPFQLAQLGFIRDPDGTLRQMTDDERLAGLTPEQRLVQRNRELLEERFGTALGDGLPSPGLERDIARTRRIATEGAERGGLAVGSTGRAQLEGALSESELIARDQARRSDISQLSTLGQNLRVGESNLLSQSLARLRGESTSAIPLIQAGATAIQPSLIGQQLGTQANLAKFQADVGLVNQFIPDISVGV